MLNPQWTLFVNISCPGSKWVGTTWEFYDDEEQAKDRYEHYKFIGNVPILRPFHYTDQKHLGAVHSKQ
jgi:hypothetical protein